MKIMKPSIAIVVSLVVAPRFAVAEIYKWVDQEGRAHYSEKASADEALRLNVPVSPMAEAPVQHGRSVRDRDGQCQTIKCVADELEADRLQRERVWAQRREANQTRWRDYKLAKEKAAAAEEEARAKKRKREPVSVQAGKKRKKGS